MGMVYTLNSPEDIAAEYGGNKQRIAQAAQAGIINPTEAVLAGMFIDRMRSAVVEEQQPNQTVAQEVLAPQQQSNVGVAPAAGQGVPSTQPTPAQGVAPTPQQMPQAPMPQGMADGGDITDRAIRMPGEGFRGGVNPEFNHNFLPIDVPVTQQTVDQDLRQLPGPFATLFNPNQNSAGGLFGKIFAKLGDKIRPQIASQVTTAKSIEDYKYDPRTQRMVRRAMGGVASLDVPSAMYDYAPGGLVAFAPGNEVQLPSIAKLNQMYESLMADAKSPAEREQITSWYQEALKVRRVAKSRMEQDGPDMDKVMGARTKAAEGPQPEGPSLAERLAGIPTGGDELPPEPEYNPRPSSALPEGRSTPSYILPSLDPARSGDEPWSLSGDAPIGGDEYASIADALAAEEPGLSADDVMAMLGEGDMELQGNETTPTRILRARAEANRPKPKGLGSIPAGGDEYAGIADAVAGKPSVSAGIPAGGDEYAGIDEVYDPKARIVGNPTENAQVMAQLAAIDAAEAKPKAGVETLIDPDAPGEDMNFNPDMSRLPTPAATPAPAGLGATEEGQAVKAAEESPELTALQKYYDLATKTPSDTKEDAMWRAITRGGFELMAGQSPYALANVGKAGTAAIGQYGADVKDIQKSELARAKTAAEFELAKAKLAKGKDTDLRYRTGLIEDKILADIKAGKREPMSMADISAEALDIATSQLTEIQSGKLGLAQSEAQRKREEAARKQAENDLKNSDLALNAMASEEGRLRYLRALDERTQQILGSKGTSTAPAGPTTKKGMAIAPNAVNALRNNPTPDMQRLFDEKYGKGEAARILGK